MSRFQPHPYTITEDADVRGLYHYHLSGPAIQGGELRGSRTGTRAEVEKHIRALLSRLSASDTTSEWTVGSDRVRLSRAQRNLIEGFA